MGAIAWAYVLSIPQNLILSKIWSGIYAGIILSLCSLLGLVELFCAVKFDEFVGIGHISVVANTNYNETVEFLSTFVDIKFGLIATSIAIFAIGLYQLMRYVKSQIIKGIVSVISICSVISTACFGIWADCGIGRALYSITTLYKIKSYNLKESQPEFDIYETNSLHPNIILIIGESFDKKHSNLYGYEKNTNPHLSERLKDSTLIVFSSVESAAPNTNMSLRQMLSLSEKYDDDSWYENPMLPTALKKCGYNTLWLSNQCATSLLDKSFSELAYLCDSVLYTTDEYLDKNERTHVFDDVLFRPFKEYVNEAEYSERNFCVIHLMGFHYRHDLRYPKNFAKFSGDDYADQPEHRRETFAAYDNSILYNDFVVDSLMSIADGLNAIVLYIPDHGLDFYYTWDIASHGRLNDSVSFKAGCQIPFMVYFTKPFRENYPEIVERTRSFWGEEFNTKYLMNTIMDMSGYDICGYNVLRRSLFGGAFYNSNRE